MVLVLTYRFILYLTGAQSGLGEVPTMQKAAEVAASNEAGQA
jgi:hypothetical protein